MTRRTMHRAAAAAAIFTLSGTTLALGPDDEQSLLKGPDVVASDAPGAGTEFDGSRGDAIRKGETPMRAYLHAIRALGGPDADPALALSDEQKETIRDAARSYGQALKAYMREHLDELREIRELGAGDALERLGAERRRGPRGNGGEGRERRGDPDAQERGERSERGLRDRPRGEGRPLPGEEMMFDDAPERSDPESRKLGLKKLRALMQDAPSDQGAKAQIWSTLSEDQQAFVQTKLDELGAQREKRISERMQGQAKRKKRSADD